MSKENLSIKASNEPVEMPSIDKSLRVTELLRVARGLSTALRAYTHWAASSDVEDAAADAIRAYDHFARSHAMNNGLLNSSDESDAAQAEARVRGMSFLVDGLHVSPDRVVIVGNDTQSPIGEMRKLVDEAKQLKADIEALRKPDELAKFREHSVLLNRVVWKMLQALNRVPPNEDALDVDIAATIDEFFKELDESVAATKHTEVLAKGLLAKIESADLVPRRQLHDTQTMLNAATARNIEQRQNVQRLTEQLSEANDRVTYLTEQRNLAKAEIANLKAGHTITVDATKVKQLIDAGLEEAKKIEVAHREVLDKLMVHNAAGHFINTGSVTYDALATVRALCTMFKEQGA